MIEERTYPRSELRDEVIRRVSIRAAHGQDRTTARRMVAAELLLEDGLDRLGPAATAEHAAGAMDRLLDALEVLAEVVPDAAAVVSARGYRLVKAAGPEPSTDG